MSATYVEDSGERASSEHTGLKGSAVQTKFAAIDRNGSLKGPVENRICDPHVLKLYAIAGATADIGNRCIDRMP